jgi:hypothetical protein
MLGCAASGGGAAAAGTELAMKECSPDMLLSLCSLARSSRVKVVIRPQLVVFLGHTQCELARAPGYGGRLRQGSYYHYKHETMLFPA